MVSGCFHCFWHFYTVIKRVQSGMRLSWFAFTPLALAISDMVIMRNYFGHHPPMASPLLLVGLVFSIAPLRIPSSQETQNVPEKISFKFAPAASLCFAYGLLVLMFFRADVTDLLSLRRLIEYHTARADTLVLLKDKDPATASQKERLEEPLDRHIVVLDNLNDWSSEKEPFVVLSPVKLDSNSLTLVAQSAVDSYSWLMGIADWFKQAIAKRPPGDRLELAGTYYLYAPR